MKRVVIGMSIIATLLLSGSKVNQAVAEDNSNDSAAFNSEIDDSLPCTTFAMLDENDNGVIYHGATGGVYDEALLKGTSYGDKSNYRPSHYWVECPTKGKAYVNQGASGKGKLGVRTVREWDIKTGW